MACSSRPGSLVFSGTWRNALARDSTVLGLAESLTERCLHFYTGPKTARFRPENRRSLRQRADQHVRPSGIKHFRTATSDRPRQPASQQVVSHSRRQPPTRNALESDSAPPTGTHRAPTRLIQKVRHARLASRTQRIWKEFDRDRLCRADLCPVSTLEQHCQRSTPEDDADDPEHSGTR